MSQGLVTERYTKFATNMRLNDNVFNKLASTFEQTDVAFLNLFFLVVCSLKLNYISEFFLRKIVRIKNPNNKLQNGTVERD